LHQFNSEHFIATTNLGYWTELMYGSWERRCLAGEWIGSLSCNQPAGRRRSREEVQCWPGQIAPRWNAANFQMMTFGFEIGSLPTNESE